MNYNLELYPNTHISLGPWGGRIKQLIMTQWEVLFPFKGKNNIVPKNFNFSLSFGNKATNLLNRSFYFKMLACQSEVKLGLFYTFVLNKRNWLISNHFP